MVLALNYPWKFICHSTKEKEIKYFFIFKVICIKSEMIEIKKLSINKLLKKGKIEFFNVQKEFLIGIDK